MITKTGTRKLCVKCKKFKTLKHFKIKKNGKPHSYCNGCRIQYFIDYNKERLSSPDKRAKEKERQREKYQRLHKHVRLDLKLKLIRLHGGCCQLCGYSRSSAALDFHHRDPKTKTRTVSYWLAILDPLGWEMALKEAQHCDLLCSNCHREKTYPGRELTPPSQRA